MWDKIKPQAMAAIMAAFGIGIFSLYVGMAMDKVEIITAVIGAAFGFLGGVTTQIYDKDH